MSLEKILKFSRKQNFLPFFRIFRIKSRYFCGTCELFAKSSRKFVTLVQQNQKKVPQNSYILVSLVVLKNFRDSSNKSEEKKYTSPTPPFLELCLQIYTYFYLFYFFE
jgi:hypothetical protein